MAATTPVPLAQKLRAAHISGERKPVTCLFADVVGSTSLAENLDPDDWTAIMNQAFDQMSPAIYRYEGTIARLMGDAILAFFGAPVTHEDDPERAVRAAFDLVEAIRLYAVEVRRDYGIDFAIRVGLNTGSVVVGNVGSNLKYEYTAMGDAVNLAARMQSAARPMTVLMSEYTYRFVAPICDGADLGLINVKGKAEPVRVFEGRALKATRARGRGLPSVGREGRLIGRDIELSRLRAVEDTLTAGRGGLITLLGEAGLGKSRLVSEWKAASEASLPERPLHWLEGRCLSYGQGLAYHLLIDIVRKWLTSRPGAEAGLDAILEAQTQALLADAAAEVYPYIAHLLSLPLERATLVNIEALAPSALQERYQFAISQWLRALAERQPVVVVCDDIHWADASSTDLLIELMPLTAEAPVVLCLLARPDPGTVGGRLIAASRAAGNLLIEIDLTPLSEADCGQLVNRLLDLEILPEQMHSLILRRAEGNPFFVEEVLRTLLERGVIELHDSRWVVTPAAVTLDIPDNIQGLLWARIDHLAEDARRSLRVASVIGRQFAVQLLALVMAGQPPLEALEASGLIQPAVTQSEPEYIFRHALIQEAAYNSLVKQDRRQLHLAVGQALERLDAGQLQLRATGPVLAHHFYAAGDDARALDYLMRAGEAAARVYANPEAALHYGRALEIARRNPIADGAFFRNLYTSLGQALELSARLPEAMALYREMEATAQTQLDPALELAAIMAQAKIHSIPNQWHDAEKASRLLERAARLAHALGDHAAESKILWNLMLVRVFGGGEPHQTVAYGEQSLALARALNLREQMAFTLNDLAYAYVLTCQSQESLRSLEEARRLWHELGNVPMLSDNLANTAIRRYATGAYDLALTAAAEAWRLGDSIGNRWSQASSQLIVGQIYFDQGEVTQAIASMEAAIALGETLGHVFAVLIRADLGWLYASLGQLDQGGQLVELAQAQAAARPMPAAAVALVAIRARLQILLGDLSAAEALIKEGRRLSDAAGLLLFSQYVLALAEGELALALNDLPRAERQMDRLLAELERATLRPYLPEALYLKGQALRGQARAAEASTALHAARTAAAALGSRRMLWPVLASLAELETRRGNISLARELRGLAGQTVTYLALHMPLDLRRSFLNLTVVRGLLAEVGEETRAIDQD